MIDLHRAPCRPYPTVLNERRCRQCGEVIVDPRRHFYCDQECQIAYEASHRWGIARWFAIERATVYETTRQRWQWSGDYSKSVLMTPARRVGVVCARCGEFGANEVNHIMPVNGRRPTSGWGCAHHTENLEVLHHRCHLEVTREQRAAGLIGES